MSDPGNYRPVSLTSVVCKILEKIIRENILDYLNKHKLISESQFGYRRHRSTILQLLTVLEDWTAALDDKLQVDSIYFDYAKAFDSIAHRRLLHKLEAYGIAGHLLKWIESFLQDRKQRVLVNGSSSQWSEVISGVPQGSILGPLLFVIYVNDMPEVVQSVCRLFADDTKLYRVIKSNSDIDILQDDIKRLCEWSNTWLLRFNIQKCKVLHIGYDNYDTGYSMFDSNYKYSGIEEDVSEKDSGDIFLK